MTIDAVRSGQDFASTLHTKRKSLVCITCCTLQTLKPILMENMLYQTQMVLDELITGHVEKNGYNCLSF